jgi:ATP-dependent helicase/nuclease subunit B
LELIAAPAGTGKTRHAIEIFRQALQRDPGPVKRSSWFILPNREHADRVNDLILRSGLPGLLIPPVATINEFIRRFARVSSEKTVGGLMKRAVLQACLRENPGSYFHDANGSPGFLDLLQDFLTEAKAGLLTSGEFKARASSLSNAPPVLAKKLADLASLFKAYEEKIAAWGLEDPADLILRFVEEAAPPPLELVILDGFYHFTRAQLAFISSLSRFTTRVIVTLTTDPSPARSHVFAYPEKTRRALIEAGFREIPWKSQENHRAQASSLAFLERHLFLSDPPPFGQSQEAVRIFEATGTSGEIEMAAREILRLYREEAYHFSDFCLLLRSIGPYEEALRSIFAEFGIPLAIHERRKLQQNPLIRAFLKWVRLLSRDWQREDLFALLDCNYYGFSQEAVRQLKKESLERGVLAEREAWENLGGKIAGEAKRILDGLAAHQREISSGDDPAFFNKTLVRFIDTYGLAHRLAETDDATREDFQAAKTLFLILDEIALQHDLHGARTLALPEYLARLEEAIRVSLFSVNPLDKNRVQVYDVAFALQKEYKVIFVLGLLERTFPKKITEDAILADAERRLLNGTKPCFEERRARISGERYFFYMALTRAREKLYLSYPRFDLEGKESLPSFYVDEVKKCLGEPHIPIRCKEVGDVLPGMDEICREEDLMKRLAYELCEKREDPSRVSFRTHAEIWNHLLRDPALRTVFDDIERDYEKAKLADPKVLERIAREMRVLSPTRLEVFATCPFKFFAAHILKLRDEREGIDVRDEGDILHETLERFFKETVRPDKADWILVKDKAKAKTLVLEKLDQVLRGHPFPGVKKFRKDLERRRLREILSDFIEKESEEESRRKTVPRYFEQAFGCGEGEPGSLEALRFRGEDGEEVLIRGIIDRIDCDPETGAAVVIDYKRGPHKADKLLDHLEKGTELQIPIYLLAVEELVGRAAAAGELYPVVLPQRRRGIYNGPAVQNLFAKSPAKTGVFSAEEFRSLLDTMRALVPLYASRARRGDIRVKSKGCENCDYNHVCRFEKWRLIYSEPEKVWERRKA